MYSEIEQVFKANAKYSRPKLILITAYLVWVTSFVLIILLAIKTNNTFLVIFLFCLSLLIIPSAAYGYILYNIKNTEVFKKKRLFFKIILCFENATTYMDVIHKTDIEILVKILKKNGINTRPKVLEAIHHYQAIMPRKVSVSIQIVPVIALIISLIALIVNNNNFFSSMESIILVSVLSALILVLYIGFCLLNERVFKVFGKDELYKRIEDSLSEIYMQSLLK